MKNTLLAVLALTVSGCVHVNMPDHLVRDTVDVGKDAVHAISRAFEAKPKYDVVETDSRHTSFWLAQQGSPEQSVAQLQKTCVDTLVTQAATALTTQTPGEQRYARLLGFFAPGSAGPRQAGPAPDQPGAVVVPRVVNWTRAFDPGNATQLGVYISVHYDIAKPAPGGTSTFGHGDVQWQLWLDHSGSGWAVTAVQMVGSSDY